jgi:hypothetical protein
MADYGAGTGPRIFKGIKDESVFRCVKFALLQK